MEQSEISETTRPEALAGGSLRSRRIAIAGAALAIAVVAWMLFRPDRVAELHEVDPDVISQVKAAFAGDMAIPSTVSIRFRESSDGSLYVRKQFAEPLAPMILRRSSALYDAVNEAGVLDKSTSLTIGPIVLVRHSREPPPFAGALLPNHFWHTRLLKRFEAKPGSRYPGAPGETFEAMIWTEIRYSTGELREVEQSRLLCTAIERAPARTVYASLTGDAVKLRCEESGKPIAAMIKALSGVWDEKDLKDATHAVVSESWFIESLGLTIQIHSQESIKVGAEPTQGNLMKFRTVEKVEVGRK